MFTLFGIVLVVAGAILTFAVDRQADGLDLILVGWILMAAGGLSLFVGMVRAAGVASMSKRHVPAGDRGDGTRGHATRGHGVERTAGRDSQHDLAHGHANRVVRPEQGRHAA